jgi:hypothetical protein
MPYLLLETLISLHCGNPSKNLNSKVSCFEVFKSIFSLCLRLAIARERAKQRHRSKEEMGNTIIPLGKSEKRISLVFLNERVQSCRFGCRELGMS